MKRIVALLLVITLIFLLASCNKISKDPIDAARKLAEQEDDYWVDVEIHPSEIEDWGEELDVDTDGVYCLICVEGEGDEAYGFIFYCEKASDARKIKKDGDDVIEAAEDEGFDVDDWVIVRRGKVVFIGYEDILEDMG